MNKPLKLIPPAQAEVLYDQALREDAFRVKSYSRADVNDWTDVSVWDDDEPDTDRRHTAVLSFESAVR